MKTVRKLTSKYEEKLFRAFIQLYPKIEADLNTQSENRWADANKEAYIESILGGTAPSKFVFARVEPCLDNATATEDIAYFAFYKHKGIELLNIDSWNRTNTLYEFFHNRVRIPEANYEIDGIIYSIRKGENDTYEKMPDDMRDELHRIKIPCQWYTDAVMDDIPNVFGCVNKGVPLNAQETRNATISDVANLVRALAVEFKEALYKTAGGRTRRNVDELIAIMCHVYFEGKEVKPSKVALDDMYARHSVIDQKVSPFKGALKRFMKVTGDKCNAITKNATLDLFAIYTELTRNNWSINEENYDAFVNDYISIHIRLLQDTTPLKYGVDKDVNDKYRTYKKLLKSNDVDMNIKRRQLIDDQITYTDYFYSTDPRRTGTNEEKLILAERQGWVTPEGVTIARGTLLTNAYHIGHILPHAQGGRSSIDNFAIQTAEDNLRLGNNPIDMSRFNGSDWLQVA